MAKITKNSLKTIKDLRRKGLSYRSIAEQYNVSYQTIHRLLRGENIKIPIGYKLSDEQIKEIKRLKKEGITYRKLSRTYGVTQSTIACYINPKYRERKRIYRACRKEEKKK